MHDFRRRSLLGLMAASAIPAHARRLQTVGVQLYTLRKVLPKNPLEILRAVEKIGYREVEVTQDNMDAIWPSLKQTSLRPVSLHMATELFTEDQAKLPAALET